MLAAFPRCRLLGALLCATLGVTACSQSDSGAGVATAAPAATGEVQRVAVRVTAEGYQPSEIHFKTGKPAFIDFTREVDSECLNAVRMPWMEQPTNLPKGETIAIAVDTSKAGAFSYSCWMSMVFGRVVIDP